MKAINVVKMGALMALSFVAVNIGYAIAAMATNDLMIDRVFQAPASFVLGCLLVEAGRAKGWFK